MSVPVKIGRMNIYHYGDATACAARYTTASLQIRIKLDR